MLRLLRVAKEPPRLSKVRFPVPVEISVVGNVKVPADMILTGALLPSDRVDNEVLPS